MKRWFAKYAIWIAATILVCTLALAEFRLGNPSLKDVLGWVGALVSTFVGAALAFIFNAIRTDREREDKECIAGNLALVTLVEFLDRLLQYEHTYIKPVEGKKDAWFAVRPGDLINIELKIDKNSLAFLLVNYAMTWRAVVLEEMRFSVLTDVIKRRNKLMNENVWPKLEAEGIAHGASIETAKVEEILGPATTQELKSLTQFIVETCGHDINSITTCIANLRNVLLELYPDKEFVRTPKRLSR